MNGSHHGDNPLLKPTGIQIATEPSPAGPIIRTTPGTYPRQDPVSGHELPGTAFPLSGVLPAFQNLSYNTSYRENCLMCCPVRRPTGQSHRGDNPLLKSDLVKKLHVQSVFALGVGEAAGVRRPKMTLPTRSPTPGMFLSLVLVDFHHVTFGRPRRVDPVVRYREPKQEYTQSQIKSSQVLLPPVLSTCPLHTNGGCGKEGRILIAPW